MKCKNTRVNKLLLISAIFISAPFLCFVVYFFSKTYSTTLDTQKIEKANASNLQFLDYQHLPIALNDMLGQNLYVKFDDLHTHTIDAFISIEDKRFFDHNGIDFIRILGAIKNNILNPNKKQGGSTITQQVIKNTQLTSEKTLDRKLKELKLAKQLEKQYSKQEILELYLNSIYFGNGCYGIESASKYYFDKPAKNLSIAQSAMLASTINAPSVYDPVDNFDKANERKNLVLKLMLKNNKISQTEYNNSYKENITIAKAVKKYKNQYYKGVISEACKILKVSETQLNNMNVQICTYYSPSTQQTLENLITSGKFTSYSNTAKLGAIVLDNQSQSVIAFASNSGLNLLNTYRQPGSVIKPIMVYAPAFESGKYSPASIVCDEPLNIGGYTPENANKSYLGNVSVKTSLAKSLNIPAVKLLNDIGISYAKNYAKGLGINFENNDNNLALALGGFTKGTTIKQLSDAYMCFANNGKFVASSFISQISQNGNVVYSRQVFNRTPVKDSVAYLINSSLKETVTNGTARRMQSLNLPLCAKTGTVGSDNGNTDAYNICYTTNHTICCWIGANDTSAALPSSVNGSTYPTMFNTAVLQSLYANKTPSDFSIPHSINKVALNQDALDVGLLEKDDTSPIFDYFDNRFIPPQTTRSKLDTTIVINNFENSKPIITFDAKRDVVYEIYRTSNEQQTTLLTEIKFINDTIEYTDDTAVSGDVYEYWVISKNSISQKESNKIKLLAN